MPIFQLNPEIGRRDYQTVEVLGEIGQSIIGAQDEVKLLAHGGRHQEEHVPGECLTGAKPFSRSEGQRDIQLQAELALRVEEPFRPEVFRIGPNSGVRVKGIQAGNHNGVLGK